MTLSEHSRAPGEFHDELTVALTHAQLEVGIREQILTKDCGHCGRHLTPTWMSQTWQWLSENDLHVHIPNLWTPPIEREHDNCIMETAAGIYPPGATIEATQRCRLCLRVNMLSNIMDGTGQHLRPEVWRGHTRPERTTTLDCPNQARPPPPPETGPNGDIFCASCSTMKTPTAQRRHYHSTCWNSNKTSNSATGPPTSQTTGLQDAPPLPTESTSCNATTPSNHTQGTHGAAPTSASTQENMKLLSQRMHCRLHSPATSPQLDHHRNKTSHETHQSTGRTRFNHDKSPPTDVTSLKPFLMQCECCCRKSQNGDNTASTTWNYAPTAAPNSASQLKTITQCLPRTDLHHITAAFPGQLQTAQRRKFSRRAEESANILRD